MLIKAGTYRFNDVLTTGEFEQDINFTMSFTGDGNFLEYYVSKMSGGVVYSNFVVIFAIYKIAGNVDGEEIFEEVEEPVPSIVYNADGWVESNPPTPLTHTIPEDTEVNDTFGTWYKANTNYNEVNGAITITWDGQLEGREQITATYGNTTDIFGYFIGEIEVADVDSFIGATFEVYADPQNGVVNNIQSPVTKVVPIIEDNVRFGTYTVTYPNYPDDPYTVEDQAFFYGVKGEYTVEIIEGATVAVSIPKTGIYADPCVTHGGVYASLYPYNLTIPKGTDEPTTPTKKFTRLYLGEVAYSSNGKRFRKLQTEEYVEPTLEAGLYDADDNLVASWDTLVNTYGMDCEKDYERNSSTWNDTASLWYIFENNSELANGVKLVIGDSVTRIGSYAFSVCYFLSFIEIPQSVTSIGDSAFYCCNGITNITIPESVTSIESGAFAGCKHLIEVCNKSSLNIEIGSYNNGSVGYNAKHIITDKSQSYLKYIDYCVFYDDGTEVKLLKYYGSNKKVTLPVYENNKEYAIDYRAFYCTDKPHNNGYPDRYNSIRSITIPDCVTSIGGGAFAWCEALTSVNFSENSRLKEIGGEAFFRTHISSINLPNSLETIKQGAFKTCTSLSSITIPESVTTIGTVTFENCSSLRTAVIRSSYGLSNLMFDSCSSLRTVTIGSSVKYIGSYVFEDCYNIANINYEGTVEQWNAIEKNSKWQGYWDTHPVTYVQCTDGQVTL